MVVADGPVTRTVIISVEARLRIMVVQCEDGYYRNEGYEDQESLLEAGKPYPGYVSTN